MAVSWQNWQSPPSACRVGAGGDSFALCACPFAAAAARACFHVHASFLPSLHARARFCRGCRPASRRARCRCPAHDPDRAARTARAGDGRRRSIGRERAGHLAGRPRRAGFLPRARSAADDRGRSRLPDPRRERRLPAAVRRRGPRARRASLLSRLASLRGALRPGRRALPDARGARVGRGLARAAYPSHAARARARGCRDAPGVRRRGGGGGLCRAADHRAQRLRAAQRGRPGRQLGCLQRRLVGPAARRALDAAGESGTGK